MIRNDYDLETGFDPSMNSNNKFIKDLVFQ